MDSTSNKYLKSKAHNQALLDQLEKQTKKLILLESKYDTTSIDKLEALKQTYEEKATEYIEKTKALREHVEKLATDGKTLHSVVVKIVCNLRHSGLTKNQVSKVLGEIDLPDLVQFLGNKGSEALGLTEWWNSLEERQNVYIAESQHQFHFNNKKEH